MFYLLATSMNMFGLKTKEGSAKQNWLGFFFFEPSPHLMSTQPISAFPQLLTLT